MKLSVNSQRFGAAWRAALVCASDDDSSMSVYRAVQIEHFDDHGLRLISTDNYVLVRAWVPLDEDGDNLEPDPSELPDATYVVSDSDLRGLGLMKYVKKLHKKEPEEAWPELELLIRADDDASQGVLAGFERDLFHISWPHHEDIAITLLDHSFPEWRKLDRPEITETKHISFTSRTLGALSKLGELYPGYTIDWTLRGALGVIDFKVGPLTGMLMPARATTPEPDDVG